MARADFLLVARSPEKLSVTVENLHFDSSDSASCNSAILFSFVVVIQ